MQLPSGKVRMPIQIKEETNSIETKIVEFLKKNEGRGFTFNEIHNAIAERSKPLTPSGIIEWLKMMLQMEDILKEMAKNKKLKTVEKEVIQKQEYYYL